MISQCLFQSAGIYAMPVITKDELHLCCVCILRRKFHVLYIDHKGLKLYLLHHILKVWTRLDSFNDSNQAGIVLDEFLVSIELENNVNEEITVRDLSQVYEQDVFSLSHTRKHPLSSTIIPLDLQHMDLYAHCRCVQISWDTFPNHFVGTPSR